jgi:hypothetical protein
MGYSHYIYHTHPISDEEWALCVDAFSLIVTDAISRGIPLSIGDAARPLSNHEILERAWLQEDAHGPLLEITGVEPEASENFMLWKNAVPPSDSHTPEYPYKGFSATKTRCYPYDEVITAFLCWLTSRLPDCLDDIGSDGMEGDWQAGYNTAIRLFPDLDITNPVAEQADLSF